MSLRHEALGLLATLGRPAAPASPFFLRTRRPSTVRPYSAAAAAQVRQSEPIDNARVVLRPESAAAARDPSSSSSATAPQSTSTSTTSPAPARARTSFASSAVDSNISSTQAGSSSGSSRSATSSSVDPALAYPARTLKRPSEPPSAASTSAPLHVVVKAPTDTSIDDPRRLAALISAASQASAEARQPSTAPRAQDRPPPKPVTSHARVQAPSSVKEKKRRVVAKKGDRRQVEARPPKPKSLVSARSAAQTTPSAASHKSAGAKKKNLSATPPVRRDEPPHVSGARRPAETAADSASSVPRSMSLTPSARSKRQPHRSAAVRPQERKPPAPLSASRTDVKPPSSPPAALSRPPPPPFSIMPPTSPPTAANLNAVVSGFQRVLDSYISFLSSFSTTPVELPAASSSTAPSLKTMLEASAFQSKRRQASEMLTITSQALQSLFPTPIAPVGARPSASTETPTSPASSRPAAPESAPAAQRSSLGPPSGSVASSAPLSKRRTGSAPPIPPPRDATSPQENQHGGADRPSVVLASARDVPSPASSLSRPSPPASTAPRISAASTSLAGPAKIASASTPASPPAASRSSPRPLVAVPEGTRGLGARSSGDGGAKTKGATSTSESPTAAKDPRRATNLDRTIPRRDSTPIVPPPALPAAAPSSALAPAQKGKAATSAAVLVWDGQRFVRAIEAATSIDQVKAVVDDLAAQSEQVDAIKAPDFWTHLISKCRELSALPVAAMTLLRADRLPIARPTATHMTCLRDALHDMLVRHAPRSDASPPADLPPQSAGLLSLDIRVLRMFLNAMPEDPVICALVFRGLHQLGDADHHDLRQLEEVILRRSATTPFTKVVRQRRHSAWTMEALDSIRPFVLPSVLSCWTPDMFELSVDFHRDRMIALARHLATRSSVRSGVGNPLPPSEGETIHLKSYPLPDMPAAFLLVNAYVEATLETAEARADPVVNLCAVFAWSLAVPDESATYCMQQHMPIMLAVSRRWRNQVKLDPAKQQLSHAHRAALRTLTLNLEGRHLIEKDTFKDLTAGLDLLDAAAAPQQTTSAAASRSKRPSVGSTSTATAGAREGKKPQARDAAGADRPREEGAEAPATPVSS